MALRHSPVESFTILQDDMRNPVAPLPRATRQSTTASPQWAMAEDPSPQLLVSQHVRVNMDSVPLQQDDGFRGGNCLILTLGYPNTRRLRQFRNGMMNCRHCRSAVQWRSWQRA